MKVEELPQDLLLGLAKHLNLRNLLIFLSVYFNSCGRPTTYLTSSSYMPRHLQTSVSKVPGLSSGSRK
jgi:hypothetical protein